MERHGTVIEVFCRILRKSLEALQNGKITHNEVIFGKHRKKAKSIELKWGSLVEFNLSQNIQTSIKAKVSDRRKLQFRCIYKEMNEVVRRGNNKCRILGVLIKHAVQICQSVISMLENQDEAHIARVEGIRSQVFEIVNKQQPKVKEAIIQNEYFSEIYQDILFIGQNM